MVRDLGRKCEESEIRGGPPPKVGDEIYVDGYLGISGDFDGGLCKVASVKIGISAGQPTWFVTVEEWDTWSSNWVLLREEQDKLRAKYGTTRGKLISSSGEVDDW